MVVYAHTYLLHHRCIKSAYKVNHISLLKRLFKRVERVKSATPLKMCIFGKTFISTFFVLKYTLCQHFIVLCVKMAEIYENKTRKNIFLTLDQRGPLSALKNRISKIENFTKCIHGMCAKTCEQKNIFYKGDPLKKVSFHTKKMHFKI